jgi:hypothetical protein
MKMITNKRALVVMGIGMLVLLCTQWYDPDSACLAKTETRVLAGGATCEGICVYTSECVDTPACIDQSVAGETTCNYFTFDVDSAFDDGLDCSVWVDGTWYGGMTCTLSGTPGTCATYYHCHWTSGACYGAPGESPHDLKVPLHCIDAGGYWH